MSEPMPGSDTGMAVYDGPLLIGRVWHMPTGMTGGHGRYPWVAFTSDSTGLPFNDFGCADSLSDAQWLIRDAVRRHP